MNYLILWLFDIWKTLSRNRKYDTINSIDNIYKISNKNEGAEPKTRLIIHKIRRAFLGDFRVLQEANA